MSAARPGPGPVALAIAAALAAGCAGRAGRESHSPVTARVTSYGLTSLDAGLVASWIEPDPEKGNDRFRFSRYVGGRWTRPRTVVAADNLFLSDADVPGVAAVTDGSLVAHWMVRRRDGGHDVMVARSTDAGKSWSKPSRLHRDDVPVEHGFVSWVEHEGVLIATWLGGAEKRPTTLRAAVVEGGVPKDETLLDAQVCDCCRTDAGRTEEGPIVSFRNRAADEVRDAHVVRGARPDSPDAAGGEVGRTWEDPRPVGGGGWRIHGCPVNGPGLDAIGRDVVVAWFTAANKSPRVEVAFSSDSGKTFGPATRVDETKPAGRVDVAWVGEAAYVSWVDRTDTGLAVRLRRVRHDGAVDPPQTIADLPIGNDPGFPRLARVGREAWLAYTDDGRLKIVPVVSPEDARTAQAR